LDARNVGSCPLADIPLDDPAAAHDGRFDTCGLEFAAAQLKPTEPHPQRERYQHHVGYGRGDHDPVDVAHGRGASVDQALGAENDLFEGKRCVGRISLDAGNT
jgi:hypothetical protein